nr:tubulin glycylase 3A-like isoform X1 [Onthophagus taurus]
MTIVKRGLPQVAKDVKRVEENTSKDKQKNVKSVQKVTSPNNSQEYRPKKLSAKKGKASDKLSSGGSARVKKKGIVQNKNSPSTSLKGTPTKRVSIDNGTNKKNIINNNDNNNNYRKTPDGKTNRTASNEGRKEDLKRIAKSEREKFSKEKLQNYVNYITTKIMKDRPSEGVAKLKIDNSFTPTKLFGTLGYYQSKLNEINKNTITVRPVSDSPVTDVQQDRNKLGVKASAKKITSKHSKHSERKGSFLKKDHHKAPSKINVRELIQSSASNKPVINLPFEKVDQQLKPKSSVAKYLSSQSSSHRSSKTRTPIKVGSFTVNLSLQERTSSRYKRLKYQTGEELLKFYKNYFFYHDCRDRVDKAIKDRKTFTVCGNFWSVRKALIARGWVEKIHYAYAHPDRDMMKKLLGQSLNDLIEGVSDKSYGPLYKRVIMSKMLSRHQVDLFWDYGCDPYKLNPDSVKLTIINHIRRGYCSYSSKEGLCEIMKKAHWYHFPGISNLRHPRSYTLTDNGDPEEFIRDFRVTAAISMLKWIAATTDSSSGKVISEAGKVPVKYFHFAINECERHVQKIKHDDIDDEIPEPNECEWNGFLENYYRCVHIGNHFKKGEEETEQSMIHKAKIMINKLKRYCSYIDMDGYMNIWILKPTAGSRGIGIHICRTLSYVLRVVSERKTVKYVIQKYIERPLLIYNTKFDIRQWFLISCTNPLTIWMYKMCYLRFSSQTYNLRKLHESIHLTNNSVQCKYRNVNRDPALPDHNMWDSNRFKTYLETIGYPNAYDAIIYPGMKQCITASILIHQENINTRRNCFELYGADFMLTEDFQPWLIEINSRPALYASTPVTGRMCPQVLEDVVKVIIDYPCNPKANTGHFDLAYKEQLTSLPSVDTSSLVIRGEPLSPSYFVSPSTSATTGAAASS